MKKILLALLFVPLAVIGQKANELRFGDEGKFKIVQFTDMHYVVGSDECAKVQKMVNQTLDEERPQLVVYTGDIITSSPQTKGWDEVLAPVIKRGIPWAVVLGNHDDEYDLKRQEILNMLVDRPFSLLDKDKTTKQTTADYVLEVKSKGNNTSVIIYCIDSHTYSQYEKIKGYDWFRFDQVKWYREQNIKYTKANNNKPLPALAFFHIPLPEITLLADSAKFTKVGISGEMECPGTINAGMYAALLEGRDVMGTFSGHDHDNNYIGCLYDICLSYGQFSGGNTVYNNKGMGARVIELTEGERQFSTWIRMSDNTVVFSAKYPESFIK